MAVQLITTALASAAAQQCTYRTVRETFTTGSCEYAAAPTSTTSRAPPVRRCSSTYVNASSIIDGWLVEGRSRRFIGTYTSQLQAYIDDAYAPITKADYENVSLVNSTVLRHLRLRGNYSCDAPLLLPSMFVLKAEGTTIVPASNLTLHNVSRFSALVMLVNVTLSAVVGGTYDASSLPLSPDYPKYTRGYHALSIHGDNSGGKNTIRNVRALANNTGASIGVNEVSHAEVSFSDIGGGAEHGMLNTRCVWTLSVTAALIHDNFIRNCSKHSLDFDAYTSGSAAYSNVIEDHGEEGIFVEETASGACARAHGSLPWTLVRILHPCECFLRRQRHLQQHGPPREPWHRCLLKRGGSRCQQPHHRQHARRQLRWRHHVGWLWPRDLPEQVQPPERLRVQRAAEQRQRPNLCLGDGPKARRRERRLLDRQPGRRRRRRVSGGAVEWIGGGDLRAVGVNCARYCSIRCVA